MPRRSWYFLISVSALLALGFTTARANRHHHSVNISGGHRQPATDCSDLRIRFDDRDAMVRSEERTLTKHEAAVLQVHPHSNGGVQVVGWDQETYAVTACKAASGSGAEAEQILSQIKMSIENGKVSTSGPGDDEEWTVYLLIRAPKSASIDMDTMNGPISLYDVDGKLTAHAKNGPISLKNFSGDAEITAVNGPISLDGGRGSVRIHTENGPISVELQGKTWSGEGLSADAKNGPVTLMVPSGYQSSFVVESPTTRPLGGRPVFAVMGRRPGEAKNGASQSATRRPRSRLRPGNGRVR